MEELNVQNQPATTPSGGAKFLAAVKEWFRKKIVALKVKPQIIPLVVLVATSVLFMLALSKIGAAIQSSFTMDETKATGICVFITTLLSLLVLVSFLNAFPKRKKPNIFFIVLVGVMLAGMFACDLVYYLEMKDGIDAALALEAQSIVDSIDPAQPLVLAHMIMLGVSGVIFALLPGYSRLIRMINTSVKLESATESMSGKIDIED